MCAFSVIPILGFQIFKLYYSSKDHPIMVLFLYLLAIRYAAALLKFIYYAQEQELLSDYYVI